MTGFNTTGIAENVSKSSDRLVTFENIVNGYNLKFDDTLYANQHNAVGGTQQGYSTGAIPFRFVTPLPDTNYKIFVNPRSIGDTYSATGRVAFAQALVGAQYPKTRFGFWVRFGLMLRAEAQDTFLLTPSGNSGNILNRPEEGEILNRRIAGSGSSTYQLQVVVV